MLTLESFFKLDAAAIKSPNLCDRFSDQDLKAIGAECAAGLRRDEASREHWMRRNEAGMDLALQIQKDKSFPWPGCSNVAFPLVTIAAMQFHARAYPTLISGNQIVKCQTFGSDPDGQKQLRADKVSQQMSWQLLYQDKAWEEQEDTAIFNLSIVGTNFKKSYYSSALRHNVSELVLAKNLVLDYWSKCVETSPRKTHLIPMFRNEIYENVMRGTWRDILDEAWYKEPPAPKSSEKQHRQDDRQGVTPPPPDETTNFCMAEQHVNLDLDCDGYAEPYIITFERESQCVTRIVARLESEHDIERTPAGKIIRISATEYFTKKTFIPSPDGGIYDIGFGVFLGPLNEAVNSLVNMLLDSGTMQTTAGGFLGRGAKMRGGVYTIAPFEWKRVDSTGDDLRKSIFPLPVNAPSDVLFQLLSLLIQYTSRVSGTTDITVGENVGQNTPAQTAQTMAEMGQKIYTAIFKRIWRAAKEEFRKLYKLNGIYLPAGQREMYAGEGDDICPVADPNITSDSTRIQLAAAIKASAMQTPGYDKDEVERQYLTALRADNIEKLFPGTKGAPPQEDPLITVEKMKLQGQKEIEQMRLQVKQAELALKDKEMQAAAQQFVMKLQEEARLNNAKIVGLNASAEQAAATAQVEETYAQVALTNAEISREQVANQHLATMRGHEEARLLAKLASETKLAEAALKANAKTKVSESTHTPAPAGANHNINIVVKGGKKRITPASDGSYTAEDV